MIKIWTIMTLTAMGFFLLGYWSAVDDRRRWLRYWRKSNDNDE